MTVEEINEVPLKLGTEDWTFCFYKYLTPFFLRVCVCDRLLKLCCCKFRKSVRDKALGPRPKDNLKKPPYQWGI